MTAARTVYRMYDSEGRLLYIGAASGFMARFHQHGCSKTWWGDVARIDLVHFATHKEAFNYEAAAIADELPRYAKVPIWEQKRRARLVAAEALLTPEPEAAS